MSLLKKGSPLPGRGACDHYRRSFRWLRFPCCGLLYACDICHELSDCNEIGVWATRQVCGHCSQEQDYHNKQCKHCGKSMSSGPSKNHWEGGKGMRNQRMLSRKDRAKYRGRAKTTSAKAKRVGNGVKKR